MTNNLQRLTDTLVHDVDLDVVYLFGSHARDRATPLSDIDLALLFGEHVPADDYFHKRLDYMARCSGILSTDRLDLIILNYAPLLLAYEIVSHGNILVERNRARRVEFETDRIMKFLDFKPVLDCQVEYTKRQLRQGTYFD